MFPPQQQSDLQGLIDNQIEERTDLDYKRALALDRKDGAKREITKDISAMANAAGGTVIYGISEFDEAEKKHLPKAIDPINRTEFSREWLDQIIGSIRPKIDGVVITPIQVDAGATSVAYVVQIPQGTTAHQALDGRYYRRSNTTTSMMLDHEITDVRSRSLHPTVTLSFKTRIEERIYSEPFPMGDRSKDTAVPHPVFEIIADNQGTRLANYVTCWVKIIPDAVEDLPHNCQVKTGTFSDGSPCLVLALTNRTRDAVSENYFSTIYSEPYFFPILPSLDFDMGVIPIKIKMLKKFMRFGGSIEWELQADNAPRKTGSTKMSEVEVIWECKKPATWDAK